MTLTNPRENNSSHSQRNSKDYLKFFTPILFGPSSFRIKKQRAKIGNIMVDVPMIHVDAIPLSVHKDDLEQVNINMQELMETFKEYLEAYPYDYGGTRCDY